MISVCFVAVIFSGDPSEHVFMLPNCAPENTGNMTCHIERPAKYARPTALCYDKKNTQRELYFGPAYEQVSA